jgi:hypothetical protein
MKKLISIGSLLAAFACFVLGCRDKNMTKKETLETWLEKNFPGQYEIDRSLRDIHPKHFYEHKHNAIVSLKADPVVQFEVTWYKQVDSIGITIDEITERTERRITETAKAREWYKKLEEAGLDRFSVGVIEQALYVLPYGEPDPATRLRYVELVMKVLASGHGDQTIIFIDCMEDSTYRQEIGEIIPFGYWRRKDTYHDDHTLLKVDFEYTSGTEIAEINKHWQFNTLCKRSHGFKALAYAEAEKWAKANLEAPYYVEPDQYIQYVPDEEDRLAVRYGFPIFQQQPDYSDYKTYEENLGMVSVRYHTDKRTFSDIKKIAE